MSSAPRPSRLKPLPVIAASEALDRAIPLLTQTLSQHWSTGQGTRTRHILWSLFTCSHLVNLGDVCSGLDRELADALAAAVAARLVLGPDVEPVLRRVLEDSGEFARFDQVAETTPDHLPVPYPPPPSDAASLRKMADSLDHRERQAARHTQDRRARGISP